MQASVKDQDGTLLNDATCIADVWTPTGTKVADDEPLTNNTDGTYTLSILPAWSDNSGEAIEGEFLAEVTATRSGSKRVRRFRYVVKFDDTD